MSIKGCSRSVNSCRRSIAGCCNRISALCRSLCGAISTGINNCMAFCQGLSGVSVPEVAVSAVSSIVHQGEGAISAELDIVVAANHQSNGREHLFEIPIIYTKLMEKIHTLDLELDSINNEGIVHRIRRPEDPLEGEWRQEGARQNGLEMDVKFQAESQEVILEVEAEDIVNQPLDGVLTAAEAEIAYQARLGNFIPDKVLDYIKLSEDGESLESIPISNSIVYPYSTPFGVINVESEIFPRDKGFLQLCPFSRDKLEKLAKLHPHSARFGTPQTSLSQQAAVSNVSGIALVAESSDLPEVVPVPVSDSVDELPGIAVSPLATGAARVRFL